MKKDKNLFRKIMSDYDEFDSDDDWYLESMEREDENPYQDTENFLGRKGSRGYRRHGTRGKKTPTQEAQKRRDFCRYHGDPNKCRRGECHREGCPRCTRPENKPPEGPDRTDDHLTRWAYASRAMHHEKNIKLKRGKEVVQEAITRTNALLIQAGFKQPPRRAHDYPGWIRDLMRHWRSCLYRGHRKLEGEKMMRVSVVRMVKALIECFKAEEGGPDLLDEETWSLLRHVEWNGDHGHVKTWHPEYYPRYTKLIGARLFEDIIL